MGKLKDYDHDFYEAHKSWRESRNLLPESGYPRPRYILLHSFAHAVIRQLAVECGYTVASIRERIYSRSPEDGDLMAGVLIYTAAPDSEGTLGGLVSLGETDTLGRATRRGVRIRVIVETSDKLEGENEYSTLRALGDDVAACSVVYYWPADRRGRDDKGKLGILHVKCAVADGRWLFLSSANLTEFAFMINMELGALVTGGVLPAQVQEHFDRLIAGAILCRA